MRYVNLMCGAMWTFSSAIQLTCNDNRMLGLVFFCLALTFFALHLREWKYRG